MNRLLSIINLFSFSYFSYNYDAHTQFYGSSAEVTNTIISNSISILCSVYFLLLYRMIPPSFAAIKKLWTLKTPKQKWIFLHTFIDYSGRLIGVRAISDCTIYWFSYTSYFLVLLYSIFVPYTIIYHIWQNQLLSEGFCCLCSFGLFASV